MLDTFYKWLEFRKLDLQNRDHEDHSKLKYKFHDADTHKAWVEFYSVYSNAFNSGRRYESDRVTKAVAETLKDLP